MIGCLEKIYITVEVILFLLREIHILVTLHPPDWGITLKVTNQGRVVRAEEPEPKEPHVFGLLELGREPLEQNEKWTKTNIRSWRLNRLLKGKKHKETVHFLVFFR